MPHVDPLFWLLTAAAGVFVLGVLAGLWWGDRRHRWDRIDGVNEGIAAERVKWEQATGRTFEEIQAKLRARPLPLPDPAGQGTEKMPHLVVDEAAGTAKVMRDHPGPSFTPPPPADVLLAEADEALARAEAARAEPPGYLPAGPEPPAPDSSAGVVKAARHYLGEPYQFAAVPRTSPAQQAWISPASLPRAAYSPQVAAYARLALVRAETAAFLAQTDARCGAFLALMHAETDAFLSGLPQ